MPSGEILFELQFDYNILEKYSLEVCVYIYICICTHMHTHTHIPVYECVCVCVHVYIQEKAVRTSGHGRCEIALPHKGEETPEERTWQLHPHYHSPCVITLDSGTQTLEFVLL